MQFAKDSFYMTLRSRLTQANPERTIAPEGSDVPAILVMENEPVTSAETLPDCFYVHFGSAGAVNGAAPLMALEASITYRTRGATDGSTDRGRVMTALDSELLAMCSPRQATKCDYTQDPPLDLGSRVFWSTPQLGEPGSLGAELSRTAKVTILFYPEGATA
jgi:hypothetical protein